jgi:hypothetical protein
VTDNRARLAVGPLLALLLAACSQADAPSDEMEQAAVDMVAAVEGEPAQLARGPFAPRNECAELPGAAQFLHDLNAAVADRDGEALVGLGAEDIKLDFGGGGGTAELRRRLTEPGASLWTELMELIELGCAANSQGGLTLPWYFEQQIPVADPFGAFVVTGTDVPLRSGPGADAPVLARLDWAAVELAPGGAEAEGMRHVRVVPEPGQGEDSAGGPGPQPPTGYVAEEDLRSIVDYRLTAASRNGKWRIISFLAGD